MTPFQTYANRGQELDAKTAPRRRVSYVPFFYQWFVMAIGVAAQFALLPQLDYKNDLRFFLASITDATIVWVLIRSGGRTEVSLVCWAVLLSSPVWLEWVVKCY